MAAPNVSIRENDLSTRVPEFPGVYGAILLPGATKGSTEPYLITNESQLLSVFTPNEKIEVGMDSAYFSATAFLQKSNKLWVRRVILNALFGGMSLVSHGSAEVNAGIVADLSAPEAYVFGTDQILLIHGANEGAWANDISLKIYNYTVSPDIVKEPDAFLIEVIKDGVVVESWVCSRQPSKKDGFGRNIYIETLLEGSNYIRAVDNLAVADTVLPKEQTTALAMLRGDDGDPVTDGAMILALDDFKNTDKYALTLLLDGGWATPAYQLALYSLAELRKDCFAILSTPYSDEAASAYITELMGYRKTDLNANTSFAGLFTPHAKIYDKFNDRYLYVSPDGFVAAAISETASNYEIWFPAAGFRRGIINVLDLRRRFTTGEMDTLYDTGINPLRFAPGRGILVWGQKTLYGRPSALDRMNVRFLLLVIEPSIKLALEDFIFELNDDITRAQVRTLIADYMENIKARRGVYDYLVVCDGTNNTAQDIDNYKMNVHLFLKPVKAAEFIQFNVVITRTGMDFSLAQ